MKIREYRKCLETLRNSKKLHNTMKQTKTQKLTMNMFGDHAKFFLSDKTPTIKLIKKLDREGKLVIEITFEVEE